MSLKIIIDAIETSDEYFVNPQLVIDDITEFLKAGHSPLTEILYKQDVKSSYERRNILPVFAACLGNLEALNLLVKAGAPDPTIFIANSSYNTNDSGQQETDAGSAQASYGVDFYNTKFGAQLFKQAAKNWIASHPDNPLPYVKMGEHSTISIEKFIIHELNDPAMLGEILNLIPPKDNELKKRLGKYIQNKRENAADFSWQAIQKGWMEVAATSADREQVIHLINTNNIDAIRSLVEMGASFKDIKEKKDDQPIGFYATSVEMLQWLVKGGANIKAHQYQGELYETASIERAQNPETLQYLIDCYQPELKKDTEYKLHRAIFEGVTEGSKQRWEMAMVLSKNGWNAKDYDYYFVAGDKNEDRVKWCVEQGALFAISETAKNLIIKRNTKTMNQLRKWGVNVTEPGMLFRALLMDAPKTIIEYLVKKGAVANGPTPWGDYEYFGMRNMGNNQLLGLRAKDKNEWMNRIAPNGNSLLNSVLAGNVKPESLWAKIWQYSTKSMRMSEALQDVDEYDLRAKDNLGKTLMHHIVHGEYSPGGARNLSFREAGQIALSASMEENATQSDEGDTWLHILTREKPRNWLYLVNCVLSEAPEKLPLLVKNNKGKGRLPSEYFFEIDGSQIQKIKTVAEWGQINPQSNKLLSDFQARYHFLEKYANAAEKSDQPSDLIFEYDPAVQDNLFRYVLAKHPDKIDTNSIASFCTPTPERIIDVIERMAQEGTIKPEILAGWRERHFNQIINADKIKSTGYRPKI